MRDIRAVVTDLDQTVVYGEGQVSAATVRAAAGLAERGIPLIIATARTPAWVMTLEPLVSWVTIAVCCGGAVGWIPNAREMIWREMIPPMSVDSIVQSAVQRLPDTAIAAYDGEKWRVTEAFAALGLARFGPVEIVTLTEISEHPVCAMSVCHPGSSPDDLLSDMAAGAQPSPFAASLARNVIDIAPAGIDKASGVTRALAEVGVTPARAIAFGDMLNDLPMLRLCGYSVAVANAHPDVLAAATAVTACVHADGFAQTLGKLGLAERYLPGRARGARHCSCQVIVGRTSG